MTTPSLVARHQDAVDAALRAAVQRRPEQLCRMMEYQLGWLDEHGGALAAPPRPRAALCAGVCDALGGADGQALPAAAAAELLHHSTRVHEAIQSGAPDQDGRPSGWWLWGPAQAINVGDALHILARLSLLTPAGGGADPERILEAAQVMDAAALELFDGQQQDLDLQLQPTATPQAYLRMAERQSGAVLGCAAQLGAMAAGAGVDAQEACRQAGQSLGLALRLLADAAQLWPANADAAPAVVRRSYPVVAAIESAPVSVKREIGVILAARAHAPKDAARLAALLDDAGARQATHDAAAAARRAFDDALARAGVAPESLAPLRELADFLAQEGNLAS